MRDPLFFEPIEQPENRSITDSLLQNITDASLDKEAFMNSETAQMLGQPDAEGNIHDVEYLYDNDLPPSLVYADASDGKVMTDAGGVPEGKKPEVKAPEVKAPNPADTDQVMPRSDAQNVLATGDLFSWPKKEDVEPVDNNTLPWHKKSTSEHTLVYGDENGRAKDTPAEAHLAFSRILYEYANRVNMTPGELDGGDISKIRAQRLDFEKQRLAEAKNESDDKVALWGHRYAGQLEHGFASSILNVSKFADMPTDVQMATINLLNLRKNKNDDVDWDGVLRATVFDPLNLVGLTSLKIFSAPFSGVKSYTGKKILDGMINTARRGKLLIAMGTEGNIYAASSEMMEQYRLIESGAQKEYDWGKIALAGAVGTGLGVGLGSAPAAARAFNRAAENMAANPSTLRMGVGPTDNDIRLTKGDTSVIKISSGGDKTKERLASDTIRNLRSTYPTSDGWDKFEITGGSFKENKKGELIFKPKFKQPAYAFHKPKGKKKYVEHVSEISTKMVNDINAVVARAESGDEAAQEIIAQARWYRDTSVKLRKQFGGLGDLFADLMGATSAQTNVRQNMENALIVLQRFSRGEFDKEIQAYSARKDSGESMGSKDLHPLFKEGKFPLITKATGELFNANSPAATEALLGLFRNVKTGKAPKTLNFAKNVLNIGDEATIDVWAARYLRDLTGQPRIIPAAEKAVAGKHLVGSTFENSKVGSEFKFGQDVFQKVSEQINADGSINKLDPTLGDLTPKDLQAVAWFMEKEKWGNMGFTDIGGSASDELALAGSKNQDRISELRDIMGQAKYSAAEKEAAETELRTLEAPLERTVLGVSPEREGKVPTNIVMAETASALDAPIRNQDAAIGYQLNNSYGRFRFPGDDGEMIDVTERSLNAEIVAREDFDPEPVFKALVDTAKKYDQDSVFMAKVVDKTTPNARPGTELFFKRRMPENFAEGVVADLRNLGVDGFTFITDARQSDRVDVQSLANPQATTGTAGLTGVRWLYVPEYDPKWPLNGTPDEQAKYLITVEDKFHDIMLETLTKYSDDIATGNVLHFDVRTANKPEGGWK